VNFNQRAAFGMAIEPYGRAIPKYSPQPPVRILQSLPFAGRQGTSSVIPDCDAHKFAVAPDRDGDVDAAGAGVLAMLNGILHQGLEEKRGKLSDFGLGIATASPRTWEACRRFAPARSSRQCRKSRQPSAGKHWRD
jgi:hypothetical protein